MQINLHNSHAATNDLNEVMAGKEINIGFLHDVYTDKKRKDRQVLAKDGKYSVQKSQAKIWEQEQC